MAGLLAGHVLADHFDRVTIIERDHLPQGPEFRAAVPRRAIFMCCSCAATGFWSGFFLASTTNSRPPALNVIDWAADTWWFNFGTWKPRFPSDLISQLAAVNCWNGSSGAGWRVLPRYAGWRSVTSPRSSRMRTMPACGRSPPRPCGRGGRLNQPGGGGRAAGRATRRSGGQRERTRFAGRRMAGQLGLSITAGDTRQFLPGLCLALLSPPQGSAARMEGAGSECHAPAQQPWGCACSARGRAVARDPGRGGP